MDNRGGLAVYVTSHGFGHLNRSVAVINRVPVEVPIAIRCHPNLFDHWRERLLRPATLEPHISDVGALSSADDGHATDADATMALAERVNSEATERLDAEAERLRDEGTAAVMCDVPPLPLVAAHRAGIPGYLLANFTWVQIYEPYARRLGGDARLLVDDLRRAYGRATAVFRAEPAMRLNGVAPVIDVGMVVSPGQDRRAALRGQLGLAPTDKLVYFYVGRYGRDKMAWERLAKLEGVHFVTFDPAPGGHLPNVHGVDATLWTGADLAASADAMVAKAGYGTVCEAMVSGVPLIYPPRAGFAEHRALDRALRSWGGGIPASARAFTEMRIERLLERAFQTKPGPPPFATDGASRVAEHLTQECRAAVPNKT